MERNLKPNKNYLKIVKFREEYGYTVEVKFERNGFNVINIFDNNKKMPYKVAYRSNRLRCEDFYEEFKYCYKPSYKNRAMSKVLCIFNYMKKRELPYNFLYIVK